MFKLVGAILLVACSICWVGTGTHAGTELGAGLFGLLGLGYLVYGISADQNTGPRKIA